MSLDFFPRKIPTPYDASYVYDARNVLVKSYSKSVVATTHGIVLVKSSPGLTCSSSALYIFEWYNLFLCSPDVWVQPKVYFVRICKHTYWWIHGAMKYEVK